MLVEQVDGIDSQPLERPFGDLFDVFGLAIERAPLASIAGIRLPSELRRDHHFPAEGSERFAYQFLVHQPSVDLGGIEERDT